MTLFTKEQATKIIENTTHLIGQPFDKELKITSVSIIPVDQDLDFINEQYKIIGTTYHSIAEKFGKGRNLSVQALSTDLFHINQSVIRADIVEYLSKEDLDQILKS